MKVRDMLTDGIVLVAAGGTLLVIGLSILFVAWDLLKMLFT